MSLNSLIDAAVEKNNDALVKSLQELIRINSVYSDPKPGMPFGTLWQKMVERSHFMLSGTTARGFACTLRKSRLPHKEYG